MIPDRIHVEGFLCYREAQEACFDGCTLWMLAGSNGSGKSALLDAITFALFGQHRAGRHNARGLINSECDSFVVEFAFRVAGNRYQARRTLTREGRPTRQICQWFTDDQASNPATPNRAGHWLELPDTRTEQGFSRWIHDNIGLNYETFTASVLLLQGRADNLLQATPSQRHALLCQIVSMDRIQQIAIQTKQRLLESAGAVKELQQQLRSIPRMTEKKRRTVRKATEQAAHAHDQATRQLEQYRRGIEQTETAHALLAEHDKVGKSIDRLTDLLGRQEATCANRQDLERIRRHLSDLVTVDDCYRQLQKMRTNIQQQESRLCALRHQTEQLEQSHSAATKRQQTAQGAWDRETAAIVSLTQEQAELAMSIAALQRLDRARNHLRQVHRDRALVRREIASLESAGDPSTVETDSDHDILALRSRVDHAREQWAGARALAGQLQQRSDRFQSVADKTTCSYCQQPLADAHVQAERARLSQQLQLAHADSTRRQKELAEAERTLHTAETQQTHLREHRQQRDSQRRHLFTRFETLQHLEQENTQRCAEAYQELPGHFQQLVAKHQPENWMTTTYPTEHDFTHLRTAQSKLQRRQQQASTNATQSRQTVEACRQQELQTISTRQTLGRQLRELSKSISERRAQSDQLDQVYHATHSTLPDDWRTWQPETIPKHILRLRHAQTSLETTETTAPSIDLDSARAQHQRLVAQRDLLEAQLQQLPDAQIALAELQQQLDKACQTSKATEAAMLAADKANRLAGEHAEQRHELSQRLQQAQHEHHLWTRLHKLLGQDGLQYDILQSAEQAIIAYANATLDRLTAGQLTIQQRKPWSQNGRNAKTLDLLVRPAMGNAPCQDVAFLSGSQKFRVAVALSLAIGQFASRTRQPVQAVIIDEGFGCLDTVNRQVMIQELKNLRGQLQRILLISHQDEFANAFPDGYHCELVNGTTRLTEFHA